MSDHLRDRGEKYRCEEVSMDVRDTVEPEHDSVDVVPSSATVSIQHPSMEPPEDRHASTFGAWEVFSLVCAWILTLSLWFHLLVVIPLCERVRKDTTNPLCLRYYYDEKYHWYFWFVFSICYVLYLVQAFFSPTRRYLSNVLPELREYTNQMVTSNPSYWWKIQCYHIHSTTFKTRDSKGLTTTRTHHTRVNTHSATGSFEFDRCDDASDTSFVTSAGAVTRVRLDLDVDFVDEATRKIYETDFQKWENSHKRDKQYDTDSGMELPGFHAYVMSYKSKDEKPWLFSPIWFWVFTALTFSLPYRHYFYFRTTGADFVVRKRVFKAPQSLHPRLATSAIHL